MPKFVIERDMPGLGLLSPDELRSASQRSCNVLRNLGPDIQWLESFVTDNKMYCVYYATEPKIIEQHACEGQFPANRISQVKNIIGPTTSE